MVAASFLMTWIPSPRPSLKGSTPFMMEPCKIRRRGGSGGGGGGGGGETVVLHGCSSFMVGVVCAAALASGAGRLAAVGVTVFLVLGGCRQ